MRATSGRMNFWQLDILGALKEALFPTRCISCGAFFQVPRDASEPAPQFFGKGSRGVEIQAAIFKWSLAAFLCPDCSGHFSPVNSPLCPRCGLMFQSRAGDDHLCGACLEKPGRFRKARAFGVYDQALMEAIHCFKYKGKVQLARPLGTLLLSSLMTHWQEEMPDLVLPVPLHGGRFRRRGFNQAYLLLQDWPRIAAALALKMPDLPCEREVLLRTRRTHPQTGLGRKTRLQNIKNAFDVADPGQISQKKILLVDDVFTTGATVDECAGVLLGAGAEWVDVLTLARTM